MNVKTLNNLFSMVNLPAVSDIDSNKVTNLTNAKGKSVANQYVILLSANGVTVQVFQSYETIIAAYVAGQYIIDTAALSHSNTTTKHLKVFLETDKSTNDIRKAMISGEYLVTELN